MSQFSRRSKWFPRSSAKESGTDTPFRPGQLIIAQRNPRGVHKTIYNWRAIRDPTPPDRSDLPTAPCRANEKRVSAYRAVSTRLTKYAWGSDKLAARVAGWVHGRTGFIVYTCAFLRVTVRLESPEWVP